SAPVAGGGAQSCGRSVDDLRRGEGSSARRRVGRGPRRIPPLAFDARRPVAAPGTPRRGEDRLPERAGTCAQRGGASLPHAPPRRAQSTLFGALLAVCARLDGLAAVATRC